MTTGDVATTIADRPADLELTDAAAQVLDGMGHEALDAVINALRASKLDRMPEKVDGWTSIEDPTWSQLLLVFDTSELDAEERFDLRVRAAEVVESVMADRPDLREAIIDHIALEI